MKITNKISKCSVCGRETLPWSIIIPDDISNGFSIKFRSCVTCGHKMDQKEIEEFLNFKNV